VHSSLSLPDNQARIKEYQLVKEKKSAMLKNSHSSRWISKPYQILILSLICGVVFITAFFAFLCMNENKAIETRYLTRIESVQGASIDIPDDLDSQAFEVKTVPLPLQQEIRRNTLFFTIITIICDAAFISMGLIIFRLVVHPINQIVDAIEIMVKGEYNGKIKPSKGPEFDHIETSITEIIRAFQGHGSILLEERSSLQALVEASTHGIVTVDPHMRIQHFNNIFCEMWKLPKDLLSVGSDGNELLRHCANQTVNPELFMPNCQTVFGSFDMVLKNQICLLDGRIFHSSSSSMCELDGTYCGRIWEVFDITERMQREQELIAAQNDVEKKNAILLQKNSSLHALLEASTHGIVTVDPHMRLQHFNNIFCEMWALSKDLFYSGADGNELVRCCANQTANPEQFMSNFQAVISSPDMVWNNQLCLLDGRILYTSSSPIRGLDGTYYGRIWEVFDITGHVQREQELIAARNAVEEKNSLLSTLLEASAHATISVDSNWCIRHFNKKFCEMWGLSEDTVCVGADGIQFLQSYCVPQTLDSDVFLSDIQAIADDQNMYWEGEVYMTDGRIFQSISLPILGLNGTFYGRTWEMADITDDLLKQKELGRAYTDLMRKDEQLTLALEGVGEGLWTWDTRTELFTLNHEFASRYRSLCESQLIDSLISAIHTDDRTQCLNAFHEIAEKIPAVGIEFEFRLQSNEGMWRWIMSRGIALDVADGVAVTATGTFVDITERKMYEKHLHEANRRMLILSQITRHDIMNQLTNVFSISTLISDEITDVHIKDLLELMDRGLSTMRDQMEFSKSYQELGLHGAAWQDVNACIEKGKLLLLRSPVELLADDIPMIFADPLFEKVVYNLIENSTRHGKSVTQIEITFLVGENDSGILTFKDNGVGIPDEDKEKIFDMNFGKNTGLGLFLTREILGLTDITIHECGQFGQSAQFQLMIPAGYWKW